MTYQYVKDRNTWALPLDGLRIKRIHMSDMYIAPFVPIDGEIICVTSASGTVFGYKIGDGVTSIDELPFIGAMDSSIEIECTPEKAQDISEDSLMNVLEVV